jgi:hypothetical protein
VRQDLAIRSDQRRRSLVAARFYAEDQAHCRLPCHRSNR